jgi:hypothetical protein
MLTETGRLLTAAAIVVLLLPFILAAIAIVGAGAVATETTSSLPGRKE